MYEDEHLNFKDEHCACVASVSPQLRIKKKNPYNSKEGVFARETFRKRKNKQFCVQEFSADREFHELTRQEGKLGVLWIVISDHDANFF